MNDKALIGAAYNGRLAVVQFLLEAGANVHSHNGWALRYAAERGHVEVVQLLLEHGGIPDQAMIEATSNLEIKELLQAKLDELAWLTQGTKTATKS